MPSAYAVGDIVEAQSVAPVDQLVHPDELATGPDKADDKARRRRTIAISAAVGGVAALGVALGVLGGTGQLGGGGGGEAAANTTSEPPDLRTLCDKDGVNCWVQIGPDIVGLDDGDEFAEGVSLAGDAARGAAPRIAVSAPESRDGERGIDAGSAYVYDLHVPNQTVGINGTAVEVQDAFGPNVSWVQAGQRLSGLPGDEVRGYLSRDGAVLALGAGLNDGPNGTQASAGIVHVFRLDCGSGNWMAIREPIYGGAAREKVGGIVALSHDGTNVAFSVSLSSVSGVGAVRVYRFSEADGSWAKMGEDLKGGASLSLSRDGTAIAVGAPNSDGPSSTCDGRVRVYRCDGSGQWVQMGDGIVGSGSDLLGFANALSLSADGTTVAIGAPGGGQDEVDIDDGDGSGGSCVLGLASGRIDVYLYDQDGDAWLAVGDSVFGDSVGDSLSVVSLSDDGQRFAAGTALSDWAEDAGYVRIFDNPDGSEWQQLGGNITGHAAGERFGTSVSLSGDGFRLAAGGWTDEELLQRGVVRLYELPWLQDVPDIVGPEAGDRFGNLVSLDAAGTRLAISAPKRLVAAESDGEEVAAGSVRVYDIGADGSLKPVGQELYGQKKDDVDGYLSGKGRRLAIGAKFNNGPNGTLPGAGKVTVYELLKIVRTHSNGGENQTLEERWTPLGKPMYGEATKEKFGKYAAISWDGNVVAVGAPDATGRGQARVFRYSNATDEWTKVGPTLDGEATDDEFGWSVALSMDGNILAASARHNTGANGAYRSGHVRVFRYDPESGGYMQLGGDIDGEKDGDHIGKVVSLSSNGMVVAVTSSGSDDNGLDSGKVRVFEFRDDAWHPVGSDIHGDGESHELMRVALSADGRRIVTASHSAEGYTGYVNVHDNVGGAWKRVGGKIRGQWAGENFGWGIAVSKDGTRLAAGGPARKAESPSKGVVRLFKLPSM